MLINLSYFVAFVALAYLTTRLSATRSSIERARLRVRSAAADDPTRH